MTRLRSNITLEELGALIQDIVKGSASDWTFLGLEDRAYVTTHEIIFEKDSEIIKFSQDMQTFLTDFYGKKVCTSRYKDHSDASYSVFTSLLVNQGGLIRLLWLNGKILSMLAGSKPYLIAGPKEKDKKSCEFEFSSYFFGFAPDSKAAEELLEVDKDELMKLPKTSWFVFQPRNGIVPNNSDSHKSLSIAKGYIRHGSIEKLEGNDDLYFLLYPKQSSNYFTSGHAYGSSLPALIRSISQVEYGDLLENTAVLTGEGSRYGDSDNTVFLGIKDVSNFINDRKYLRFSFNAISTFQKSKVAVENKDLITRKYSVMTEEDTKKYTNNPRYDIVTSPDGMFSYIRKSDKLKATALQTRITKSLREDFIQFLNWIFYFQLAADLDPAMMHETFAPTVLYQIPQVSWLAKARQALADKKQTIYDLANDEYRTLYMGESDGGVTPYTDGSIFNNLFGQFGSGSYHYNDTDPRRIMRYYSGTSDGECISFNKKFSLNLNLPAIMLLFARGNTSGMWEDKQRLFFTQSQNLVSFMTTNFILSTAAEHAIEEKVKNSDSYGQTKIRMAPFWHFQHHDALKDGQLLRTMVHLSPEALMIFNSVANLNTPTDIISWLELAKEYFITTLPQLLVTKYGPNKVGTTEVLSDLFHTGIEYYLTILSAAEPFSVKMLNTDETGD